MSIIDLTQQHIFQAQKTIAPVALKTPLMFSTPLSERFGANIYLKLETVQPIGAFKIRGATNKILNLNETERRQGVIAVSTGNHGRAVAYVARQLGLTAVICISERVPPNKVNALRQLGAEVVIHGQSQDEAGRRAVELQRERGLTMVDPFDDPYIIAGQGTIGLELLEDLPLIDTVLVPLSGGGLIGGIALALKSASPAVRVIGVSMERGPAMYYSLKASRPVQMPEEDTLADSLQGGIGLENHYTLDLVRDYVDEIVLLSEEEIAAGMAYAFWQHHLVLEGGGAVGIGALLSNKVSSLGQCVAVVLSGGNIELKKFLGIVGS